MTHFAWDGTNSANAVHCELLAAMLHRFGQLIVVFQDVRSPTRSLGQISRPEAVSDRGRSRERISRKSIFEVRPASRSRARCG